MSRELTIIELCTYLPYGLNLSVDMFAHHNTVIPLVVNNPYSDISLGITINGMVHYNAKPILRPLADLTREITHDGTTVVLLDWINDNTPLRVMTVVDTSSGLKCLWCENVQSSHFNAWPYSLHKILASFHFDIFNLIPDGLAIDINEIQTT